MRNDRSHEHVYRRTTEPDSRPTDRCGSQPKQVMVDGETFTSHGLTELLAAYKAAQLERASQRTGSAIKFSKIVSGGSISRGDS